MKRIFFFVSVIATAGSGLTASLVACGGSTEDAAVVTPGTDSGGGSSSGATSSTSSGGSTTSSGGSTTSSSGSTNDAAANDGGGANDGGASSGTPNQIKCGTATCNAATQKCCTTFSRGQGAVSTCVGTNDACQGADQACDDKADCPANQICCAGGGGGGSFGASCQASCGQGIQLCKAANECVDGGTCQTYTCFNQQVSLCRKPQFGCQ